MDKIITSGAPGALAFSATYVAALIVLGIVLTFRVVMVRRAARISLGDGANPALLRRIRAHGNFAEQVPLVLAVLVVLPLLGAREWMVHLVGASALTGRILHAIAVSKGDHALKFRVLGMVLTFTAQALGALLLLFLAWRG